MLDNLTSGYDDDVVPFTSFADARPYENTLTSAKEPALGARGPALSFGDALAGSVSPHVMGQFLACLLHPDADPSLADGGVGAALLAGLDWTDLDPSVPQGGHVPISDSPSRDDPWRGCPLSDVSAQKNPSYGGTRTADAVFAPTGAEVPDPEDARRDATGQLIARAMRLANRIDAYDPDALTDGNSQVWLLADAFDRAVQELADLADEGDPAAGCVRDHLWPKLVRLRAVAEAYETGGGSDADDEPDGRKATPSDADRSGVGRASAKGTDAVASTASSTDDDRCAHRPIRVQVLSDLHIDVRGYRPVVADGIDAIVVAGDVREDAVRSVKWLTQAYAPTGVPLIYVTGNHEPYGCVREPMLDAARTAAAGTPVHLPENGEIVLDVRGRKLRVLGATLWTDLDVDGPAARARALRDGDTLMNDYVRIRTLGAVPLPVAASGTGTASENGAGANSRLEGHTQPRTLTPGDTLRWHKESRAWLTERLRAHRDVPTVVVTHHPPHPTSLDPRFAGDGTDPFFASDLSGLIEACGPDVWVHGHVHQHRNYVVGRTRIVCNPRGYPGEHSGLIDPFVIELPTDGASGMGIDGESGRGDAS